jgi:hypothetical protein
LGINHDMAIDLQSAFKLVQEGRVRTATEADLREAMQVLLSTSNSQPAHMVHIFEIPVKAIRFELECRDSELKHNELIEKQNILKSSVEDLKKPHWTLTPSFWVAFMAMVFAAIAAWPVMRDWFPSVQPVHKDAVSPSPQSNSAPVISLRPAANTNAPMTNSERNVTQIPQIVSQSNKISP